MTTEKEVTEVLKTCYDPEIPVNIVDLGLVYETKIDNGNISIKLTLTSPACPLGDVLVQQIKNKLMPLDDVKDVNVEIVWDPPWDKDKMSQTARRQLGL